MKNEYALAVFLMLGQYIYIFWPDMKKTYLGQIRKWWEGSDLYSVFYYVDDMECKANLAEEQWCFVETDWVNDTLDINTFVSYVVYCSNLIRQ